MPRDLWSWDVDIEVADLSNRSRLARVGLDVPRPGRLRWPPYQRIGESLHAEGWAGLIAPSAARPQHLVLCLFRTASGAVAGARPIHRPHTSIIPRRRQRA